MQEASGIFSRRNIIIAAVVIFVLIVSVLVFLLLQKPKQESQNSVPQSQSIENNSEPESAPKLTNQNAHYDNGQYSILYPSEWKMDTIPVVSGGSLDSFVANPVASGEGFPRVDVQVTPTASGSSSIQRLINNLSILGLKEDTIEFHGQQARRLSGVLPMVFEVPGVGKKKVFKTYIFLNYQNSQYVIDYAYYPETEATSMPVINKVLDSYSFQ